MQTLLAYAMNDADDARFREGALRVERHYAPLAGAPLRHESVDVDGRGLHIWEACGQHRRWRSWHQERELSVATLHAPVNYERLVGEIPPDQAAVPLVRRLLAQPASVLQLGCPFVLAALDPAQLVLLTDAAGLGRLLELPLPGGWIWTNRPAAAFLFAGLSGTADMRGWRYHAGCEWFMDDSTPFRGLSMVGPATCIRVGARGRRLVSHLDPVTYWLSDSTSPLDPDTLDQVAEGLQRTARSAARLWTETPRIGLSGGRDSRVVTAAFLTSGVEVDLHTNANPPGEADIACELVTKWGKEVRHEVRQIASVAAPARHEVGALDRALRWMRYSEGLHPPSYLSRLPPSSHARAAYMLVSGAAGELAHGHYYPADVTAVEALHADEQLKACAEELMRRQVPKRGLQPDTRSAVATRIADILRTSVAKGTEPLVALDVFYLLERLRRWGTSADQADIMVPLLTPEFVQAALRLTPRQRKDNALHRALILRMIPSWADVPFYSNPSSRSDQSQARPPRLWQVDEQRELMAAVIQEPQRWADAFDVKQVQEIWQAAVGEAATSGVDAVLQRVIWRAAFGEYLAELSHQPLARPAPIPVTAVGKGVSARAAPLERLSVKRHLRRHPTIRKAANTRLGRRLRRMLRQRGRYLLG